MMGTIILLQVISIPFLFIFVILEIFYVITIYFVKQFK